MANERPSAELRLVARRHQRSNETTDLAVGWVNGNRKDAVAELVSRFKTASLGEAMASLAEFAGKLRSLHNGKAELDVFTRMLDTHEEGYERGDRI